MSSDENLDLLSINCIRCLSLDAVEAARSGHPGAPLGFAPACYTLWTRFLKHSPSEPKWPGRDRFILSAGHASMLLYSLLHLTGYDLTLDDIRNFRQLDSRTPGHPEYGLTPGVEATTGPLGQGVANAVGMALGRELIGARFNRPGFELTDYHVYAACSDGDMMEGVCSEAASLAGHLGLGRLVLLYDSNGITIEGSTDLAFSEDVAARFGAYGWKVVTVEDANDLTALSEAIATAREERSRPALVIVHSKIGFGSPNLEGSETSHGAPFGPEEVMLTKRNLGFPEDLEFHVPDAVRTQMRKAVGRGKSLVQEWEKLFSMYSQKYPELAAEWQRAMAGELPEGWEQALPQFEPGTSMATRNASGKVLESLAPVMWELIGGSADLGPSNITTMNGYGSVRTHDFSGRNIHYGIREHAMGSIMNGIALHGGIIPYGGTFLVFSDYMRPSVRLAALMGLKVIYLFTHDSLGVGEDGPTHQPVEQLATLRAIPGLTVIRPCDANAVVEAWRAALTNDGPTAIALSRQGLRILDRRPGCGAEKLALGAYVVTGGPTAEITIIATGSELSTAMEASGMLESEGISTRVVDMPSWELFDRQAQSYREEVFPEGMKAVVVEAGISQGWHRYVGMNGETVTVDDFGVSAPGPLAMERLGISVEAVVQRARKLAG